jgi:hypothetical protein
MEGQKLKIMTRKEVSMEPLQNNGGLWGLQKREYFAKRVTQFSNEFIVDMMDKPSPGFGPFVTDRSVVSGQIF